MTKKNKSFRVFSIPPPPQYVPYLKLESPSAIIHLSALAKKDFTVPKLMNLCDYTRLYYRSDVDGQISLS